MTAPRDPDRLIHAFLLEGAERLHDQVYDAVRADIERKRQRVVIGPWRMPNMTKLVPLGIGIAAVAVAVFVGGQLLDSPAPGGVGAMPSVQPSTTPAPTATPAPTPIPVGGTVQFKLDGAATTTVVDAVATGTRLSGTAVTTSAVGTHTVRLECAARQGDRWAFAGTLEQSTFPGESAGNWSAVVIEDGTPQQIGIVFGIEKLTGNNCDAKWGTISMADMNVSNPVESGELVPPPDLAP